MRRGMVRLSREEEGAVYSPTLSRKKNAIVTRSDTASRCGLQL